MSQRRGTPFAPYEVDWGAFAPLRLRARAVAEGVWAGAHRSVRKGAGVEFGGQRPYVPGDDLRYLDRRSLLRHDRLLVREFETETDCALWLLVDATASMGFRGQGPGSKFAFGALVAAALARVALAGGDPVGLAVLGGSAPSLVPPSAASDTFDRVVDHLERSIAGGDWTGGDAELERAFGPVRERARRGARFVLVSDLVDLPSSTQRALASLGTRGRRPYAAMVLSPDESRLPFTQFARFRPLEGGEAIEADPDAGRAAYLAQLDGLVSAYRSTLVRHGGELVRLTTTDDPVEAVRSIVRAIAGDSADVLGTKRATPWG
jgi:uncharacterized protein (DUF58 family)